LFLFFLPVFLLFRYQLTTLNHEQQNVLLGGPIALLKAQSTVTFESVDTPAGTGASAAPPPCRDRPQAKPKAAQTSLAAHVLMLLVALFVRVRVVRRYCAREAAQIFGGLAYTRGGQGEKVERLYREVRAYAIPAGSEEIMLDLGVRQAIKNAPNFKAKM
jgi:hypothetical protein